MLAPLVVYKLKHLKNDAPEGTWQLHDSVCSWAIETNPSFKRPKNWNLIVEDCVRAKNALGLDICCFDVMVQGSKKGVERENLEWIPLLSPLAAGDMLYVVTEKAELIALR